MVKRLFLKKGGGVIVISKSILITCYLLLVTKYKMQTTRNDQAKGRQEGNEERGSGSKGGGRQGEMSNGGTVKGMKIKVQRTKCNG